MRCAVGLQVAWLALWALAGAAARLTDLTRRDSGDTFTLVGEACGAALCSEHGAGATEDKTEESSCKCACPMRAPLFREDRELCVDDLPECSLATFGGGGGSDQRMPFVYLPLKGQIIHPSKEITFPGVKTPICAVSGAQYLTRKGLAELRNSDDADVPFSLFRDEGKTFLQWAGDESVRTRMLGQMMLVRLLCRDVSAPPASPLDLRGVFTPCVAFRVQGSPASLLPNVSEVQFALNAHTSEAASASGLTVSEYVAIGISSLLLGLIYVASVFLYLHIRKKRQNTENEVRRCIKGITKRDGTAITEHDIVRISNDRIQSLPNAIEQIDEVIVKNNPLIGMTRQFHDMKNSFSNDSGSNVSDSEDLPDSSVRSEDNRSNNQFTSAVIHPNRRDSICNELPRSDISMQTESNIERLPDEHVSIVETSDETPTITRPVGTTRRKLYFNPAYFEPHLMAEPPPAALEFLTKIREVITIAKHKMAAKRFQPVLNEIPEEETFPSGVNSIDLYHGMGSQRSGSVVTLKRENSRKRSVSCVGCPGCKLGNNELQNFVNYEIPTCSHCMNRSKGDKQTIIRKWLENIPPIKEKQFYSDSASTRQNSGMLNSLLSLPSGESKSKIKKQNSFNMPHHYTQHTEMFSLPKKSSTLSVRSEPSIRTYNLPLPEFENVEFHHNNFRHYGQTISRVDDIKPIGLSDYRPVGNGHKFKTDLPDMVNEAVALEYCSKSCSQSSSDEERFYKIPKAAITTIRPFSRSPRANDYETDSLERTSNKKNVSSPTEFTDVPSSQASPSLSTALPLEEELTMHNAIYKNSSTASNTPSPNIEAEKIPNHYETIETKDLTIKNILGKSYENSKNDYSLVTEVYVNNNYNFGSAPTSPSSSECSMGKRKVIKNTQNDEGQKPGSLMIEVKDCPDNYIKIHESDGFEPDTLDRKNQKQKEMCKNIHFSRKDLIQYLNNNEEIPIHQRFQLRSSGTFKRDYTDALNDDENKFNSLRRIYDQRNNTFIESKLTTNAYSGSKSLDNNVNQDSEIHTNYNSEEGKILTLELRHSKRQRQSTPPTIKQLKSLARPDVLPPLPPSNPIYEHPTCPPRRVEIENMPEEVAPKNVNSRSFSPKTFIKNMITDKINSMNTNHTIKSGLSCDQKRAFVHSVNSDYENLDPVETVESSKSDNSSKTSGRGRTRSLNKDLENKPIKKKAINTDTFIKSDKEDIKFRGKRKKGSNIEDSGYLSSDSNCSRRTDRKIVIPKIVSCSESDDTENEARSESGAESVETHSVFFGSFRNLRNSESNNSLDRRRGKRHSNRETKTKSCL